MNKICKMLVLVEREKEISNKIKKVLKSSQNFNKNFHNCLKNFETKNSKMHIISSCLDLHKKCLIDHCIAEIRKIFKNYEFVKELDSSRLLFLNKKTFLLKTLIRKILSKNTKTSEKLLI